ncbi:MAG: tetratricopeptide repeat protein [Planctomycetes bacterium]|nr:tetratricopeptide repeat protein [Planctomycetota bacterium]
MNDLTQRTQPLERERMSLRSNWSGSVRKVATTFAMAVAIAVGIVVMGGSASAQTKDDVTLKNGKTEQVAIKSADYDGIYFVLQKGAESKFKWSEVSSVRFGGARELYVALDAAAAGKLGDADAKLDKLLADSAKLRAPIRQEALFAAGTVARRSGNTAKAIESWRTLLKDFPKSRYLLSTGANLLSALLAVGDVAGASSTLDNLTAAAKQAGLDANAQSGMGVLRGRIYFEQKKYAEAQTAYAAVASSASDNPDVIFAAKLGLAQCAQQQGKGADAERLYRELTLAEAMNTVLAGAWNGLGDLAMEQGAAKRDQDKLRDAVFCYMRGIVLYGPTPEETTDEYERARAGAAKAFDSLGQIDADPEKKKQSVARAREQRTLLEQQFPNSRWLKK